MAPLGTRHSVPSQTPDFPWQIVSSATIDNNQEAACPSYDVRPPDFYLSVLAIISPCYRLTDTAGGHIATQVRCPGHPEIVVPLFLFYRYHIRFVRISISAQQAEN